ncbi:peptidoglycan-recognition protein LC isoform X6 [Drosophila subpulchrella]|uniref:peptidoglycan-recognition protein LC isoform X6 n=1 Tax=Drosophila subpulchrella TaxID=1486046 RepID=UPI0018A13535|nr:peptidoglycan-recognition protein LC isoform X6 [Drosophila subpulchrella]
MSRNALKICLKCHEMIVNSSGLIQCDNGLCGRLCHRKCSELSEDQLKMLDKVPNLRWKCDICLGKMKTGAKLIQCLENSLREHEKRLEILEKGLEKRSKLDDPAQPPPLCPFLPNTIGRKAVTITVVFVLLTILLGIVLATTTNLFGKSLNQIDDSEVHVDGKLVVIGIKSWGGVVTRGTLEPLNLPVSRVIISDTPTETCDTRESCSYWVRVTQSKHMDSFNWGQIGYNFMVGGDGRVYEGRGWNYVGAHTRDNNDSSIGISFIGSFRRNEPTPKSLEACQLLLEQGVRLKKLKPDYQLLGHRQITGTLRPAEELYRIIQTWPHWSGQYWWRIDTSICGASAMASPAAAEEDSGSGAAREIGNSPAHKFR